MYSSSNTAIAAEVPEVRTQIESTSVSINPIVPAQIPILIDTIANSDGSTTSAIKANLEAYVRSYFKNAPILAKISYCESRFNQFAPDGSVLRGNQVHSDVGVMQINEYYHGAAALKHGYDLHTADGNMAYAEVLYSQEGTKPWKSSEPCWGSM